MQKFIKCFQNIKNNNINTIPSMFIFFASLYLFYYIQYILNNYIMNSTESLIIFFLGSLAVNQLYYIFNIILNYLSTSYNNIKKKEIKYYIISNLIKSALLFVYTPSALNILYTTICNDEWDNLKIKNMGSLYAIPDFVSLFMVKNMHQSTKIHHIIVVIFYFTNLLNDYNEENIFRPLMIYAIFSTLSYAVNFILASRFIEIKGKKDKMITMAFFIYLTCCILNWSWNIYYIQRLIYINNNIMIYLYLIFISFIVWDDIVLLKWLKYKSFS